jgi:hypothetical protein
MGTSYGAILDLFEGESRTPLTDFLMGIAEGNLGKERQFLRQLFKKYPEGDPDHKFMDLKIVYIHVGFAGGFALGGIFDPCDEKPAAAASELKQRLIEEDLLKYEPKGKKREKETDPGPLGDLDLEGEFSRALHLIKTVDFALGNETDSIDGAKGDLRMTLDEAAMKLERIDKALAREWRSLEER